MYLYSCAYEPHRHDTYAIGITTSGVQTFRYHGSRRVCLPGQLHVLNPDETHDGAAGTGDVGCAEIAATVAEGLLSLSGRPHRRRATIDIRAVELVRDYLAAHACEQTPASTLEKIAEIDRFTIARHFRWAFGTSPDRYRTLRRLELARAAIESGHSLARAAAEAGFADQSRMTRQFKRTYGLTPGRWIALTAASSGETSRDRRAV